MLLVESRLLPSFLLPDEQGKCVDSKTEEAPEADEYYRRAWRFTHTTASRDQKSRYEMNLYDKLVFVGMIL